MVEATVPPKPQNPPKEKALEVIRSSLKRKAREWRDKDRGDGFVVIQIDGLPHTILMEALSEGYMPFTQSMLTSGSFNVSRYRCGIPGNTPATQSGIMYGNNDGIPAFRWLNKADDRLVSFKNPRSAQNVEKEVARGRRGILEQGSSYVNLISGGASRSVFTLSTFLTQDMQKRLSGLTIFSLFILNIVPVLRTVFSSLLELIRETFEYLEVRLKGGAQKSEGFFPLVRIFSNVLFFEVATVGALIDMSQGRRAIYLTYNGYDEAAHQRGPKTKYALKALRGIDRGIKKVARQAQRKKRGMRYDLFVLSDHGHHPSIPFRYQYGETLESFVYSKIKEGRITQYQTQGQVKDYLLMALTSTLWSFADQNLFFLRNLFKRVATYMDRNLGTEEEKGKAGNIAIVNSSPMSNLYFSFSRERVNLEEVERVYPGLVGALVRHDGVGLVMGHSNGNPMILSKRGRVTYLASGKEIDGRDPLEEFSDAPYVEHEILKQFSMTQAGDIVLYGALKESHVVNFEEQMGGHGGVGGMQNYPFILYPRGIDFPFRKIKNARELYEMFSQYLPAPKKNGSPG